MNTLRQLQGDFQACVFFQNDRFREQIVSTAQADASQRLAIYQQAYRLRLLEVLELDYPGLRGLIGEQKFRAFAEGYIETHPSTNRSVRHYGAHLASYLRRSAIDQSCQEWGEMAEFEWLKGEAFDAANAPQASIADLAGIPASNWPRMRITFHPSFRSIDLGCNIPEIWRSITDAKTVPDLVHFNSRQPWLIWRSDLMVRWRPVEPDETVVLNAMRGGSNFADVCGILHDELQDNSQAALRAVVLLKRWLKDNLISTLDV